MWGGGTINNFLLKQSYLQTVEDESIDGVAVVNFVWFVVDDVSDDDSPFKERYKMLKLNYMYFKHSNYNTCTSKIIHIFKKTKFCKVKRFFDIKVICVKKISLIGDKFYLHE